MLLCVLYGTMWKNMVQPYRPQTTVWHMHVMGWMPKATDAHSEYVTLQVFTWQLCLCEHASVLCYTYIAC